MYRTNNSEMSQLWSPEPAVVKVDEDDGTASQLWSPDMRDRLIDTFDRNLLKPMSVFAGSGDMEDRKMRDILYPVWAGDWDLATLANGSKPPELDALVGRIRETMSPLYAQRWNTTKDAEKNVSLFFDEIGGAVPRDPKNPHVVAKIKYYMIGGEARAVVADNSVPTERFVLRNEQLLHLLATQVCARFRDREEWTAERNILMARIAKLEQCKADKSDHGSAALEQAIP